MRNMSTRKLVLLSLMSAMCYVILYIKIPIPAPVGNPFFHLGNMLVLLFALLFGGPIGGLAGSIGMGLHDLLNGYAIYAPKTIILKFLMGLVCGVVFAVCKKRKIDTSKIMLACGIIFAIIATLVLEVYISTNGIIEIASVEKTIALSPLLFITAYILSLCMLVCYFFMKDKHSEYKIAIFAATCGVVVNVIGEFVLGGLQYMITTGISLGVSLVLSAVSLPATLLVGIISILVAINLFYIIKNKTNITDLWNK